MKTIVDGPTYEQIARDAAGQPDGMDPRDALNVLKRMRTGVENLRKAVRWPRSDNWSEPERVAAEYQYQCQMDALELAIDLISGLTSDTKG